MTSYDAHDALAQSLRRLQPLAPDPNRAECVRRRCRAQLGRSRRRNARLAVVTAFAWRSLPPVVVGGFCLLYTALLVATTLRLHDVLG
jgi:hypothetical protein